MEIFNKLGYKGNIEPYDKRIPKTQLFLQGELVKTERDLLTERVEQVRLMYVFNKQTYPMEVVVSVAEHYDTILILYVELKKEVSLQRLSKIIQETLPSPALIIFQLDDKYLFSSALKRLNKSERGKIVVEEYHYSSWILLSSLTEPQSRFLGDISYGNIPALDYKQAYAHIHRQIYKENNAIIIEQIEVDDFDILKQKTEEQKSIQQEIDRLAKLLNQKSVSLKEKVELAKQIKQLETNKYL